MVIFSPQDSEALAKDEVQKVLQMTEERRHAWEQRWEDHRNRLEQNLQVAQFYFDLRQVGVTDKILVTHCPLGDFDENLNE